MYQATIFDEGFDSKIIKENTFYHSERICVFVYLYTCTLKLSSRYETRKMDSGWPVWSEGLIMVAVVVLKVIVFDNIGMQMSKVL